MVKISNPGSCNKCITKRVQLRSKNKAKLPNDDSYLPIRSTKLKLSGHCRTTFFSAGPPISLASRVGRQEESDLTINPSSPLANLQISPRFPLKITFNHLLNREPRSHRLVIITQPQSHPTRFELFDHRPPEFPPCALLSSKTTILGDAAQSPKPPLCRPRGLCQPSCRMRLRLTTRPKAAML